MAGNHIPMTKAGADAIKREIKRLKAVERPRIVQEIAVARDHGDLSENAEYHAAKERQSHVEGRIQMLEDRLARAEIIDVSRLSGDRVVFGATVKLEGAESGQSAQYTIVGETEADLKIVFGHRFGMDAIGNVAFIVMDVYPKTHNVAAFETKNAMKNIFSPEYRTKACIREFRKKLEAKH